MLRPDLESLDRCGDNPGVASSSSFAADARVGGGGGGTARAVLVSALILTGLGGKVTYIQVVKVGVRQGSAGLRGYP